MSSPRRPSPADLAAAHFRKSSHSGANNACVEIAELGSWVGVRDSKDPAGPALCFPAGEFAAFLTDVKNGNFAG